MGYRSPSVFLKGYTVLHANIRLGLALVCRRRNQTDTLTIVFENDTILGQS
jgi:hypothetical protein